MLDAIFDFDNRWFLKFNQWQRFKPLTQFFRFASRTGDGYLYALFGALALASNDTNNLLFVKVVLLAFLFEIPSFILLKQVLKRQRPFEQIGSCFCAINPSDKFSMPSGHTAAAFIMACLISQFYPQWTIAAYIWASIISFSRVFLGVHYPTDLAVGAVLGLFCSYISLVTLL